MSSPQQPVATDAFDVMIGAIDVGGAYQGVRERLTHLLAPLDDDGWNRTVPHCPDWTVRQTLAHLVGVVDDAVNGNLAGVGTDEWTKVQVDKRANVSGPQLLDDWNTYAPLMEGRLSAVGLPLAQALFDASTHEHDLRFALQSPGARSSEAVWVGVQFIRTRMAEALDLGLTLDNTPVRATNEAGLTLSATAFDALRVFASRRTEAQIRTLSWSGDPAPVLAALPFALPAATLNE